jgi:methyl-accepting chemotaxis protein
MHPIRPQYDNKIFTNTPKVPFVELGVNKLLKIRKDRGFIHYKFYNPATKRYEFKVSLVRVFKPYNWIIGTGRYVSDVSKMVQKNVLEDIQNLRYGKNGYFWVTDMNYKMLMHPIFPKYNGKTVGKFLKLNEVKKGIDKLKTSGKNYVFVKYKFYNPASKKIEEKISIITIFKPWNWVIGTGSYLNDIDKIDDKIELQYILAKHSLIKTVIITSLIILLIPVLIGYYLTTIWIINPMKKLDKDKHHFEEIATFDYLTNIINRRSFFEKAKDMILDAEKNSKTICGIMVDIDFFKKINDTYGHEAGDEVLKKLTAKISSIIRETDIFGRIGGEEFAILMENCDKKKLWKIAEKIREEIAKCSVKYDELIIKCTISIGAYVAEKGENIETILKRADELLYKAKENGRDRVEINE